MRAFSLNGEICIDPFRFLHVSGTIRNEYGEWGWGRKLFLPIQSGRQTTVSQGLGSKSVHISRLHAHTKKHETYPYHISHITYHRPQPQPRPRNLTNYTTPYKSGENRTTTNQNGNIQRGTCSADILTYSVHTYLPTYLSSSSFHLPSSIFSFHFSFSCPILRFMLHVSCFMLYVFFVSFFVLHRSIDYLFTQRSTECFFHITEYLCFCT